MKADNAVGLAKFKSIIRLLNSLKDKKQCQIEFIDDNSEIECQFRADHESYKILNRHIQLQGHIRFIIGAVIGFLVGLLGAYIIIPSVVTYTYSSEQGLIPPEYDLLFKRRKPYEQAVQILTHETIGESKRNGGPYRGKKMYYAAKVNDSTIIELWYKLADKSLIENISQDKGGEFIRGVVQEGMESSGIDSAAKYYGGVEESNVAIQVSDAISRTTIMKVEQGFLSEPVLRIIIDGQESKMIFTNFLPWNESYRAEFSIKDSDPADIETKDNCREGRNLRVPVPRDSQMYKQALKEFVTNFIETDEVHQ